VGGIGAVFDGNLPQEINIRVSYINTADLRNHIGDYKRDICFLSKNVSITINGKNSDGLRLFIDSRHARGIIVELLFGFYNLPS
jgi:hypothetical protein